MLYKDAERLIRPGDIFAVRGQWLHSRAIQWATRSVYSHVGIACRPFVAGMESLDILEALEGRGVHSFPLERYLAQGYVIDWYAITDPAIDRDRVVQWAWHRRGARYASPRQFVRSFVTTPLLESLGLPTKIDSDRYFCSWFAAGALLSGGWQPDATENLRPELSTPGGVTRFTCLQRRGTLLYQGGKQR